MTEQPTPSRRKQNTFAKERKRERYRSDSLEKRNLVESVIIIKFGRDGLLEGGDRAEEEDDGGGQGAQGINFVLRDNRQQILQEGRASQETGGSS